MSSPLASIARIQRVRLSPRFCLFVKSLDVGLELAAVNAPHPATTELDSRKVTRSYECVDLRDADVQVCRNVLKRQEARFYDRSRTATVIGLGRTGHPRNDSTRCCRIPVFGSVCRCLTWHARALGG